MAKLQLSLANVADAATLSGGLWLGTAPLANLQQRLLSKVARTVDLLATSTRLDIDLGNASTIVRFVALARHNLTTAATYRIQHGARHHSRGAAASDNAPLWVRVSARTSVGNVGRPSGLPTGSPPSPPPHLIRPTVRRLLRSPRFRVRVPILMAGLAQPTGTYSRATLRAGVRIGGAAAFCAIAPLMP